MVTLEELAARLDRVETQLALHRLAADYCVGADHRDEQRWRSVWTPDAVWDAAVDDSDDQHRFRGITAITAAVRAQWATFPVMQHATANHVVQLDGADADLAEGRCDVVVIVQLPDERWIVGGGTYEDAYRRLDGQWRIASRRVIRPFDLQPLPAHSDPLPVRDPQG
jgi:hypothetical protein